MSSPTPVESASRGAAGETSPAGLSPPATIAERRMLAGAIVALWIAGLAVRVVPMRALARLVPRAAGRARLSWTPARLAALVWRASASCWPRPSCLAQALVLARRLARDGRAARVVVGVTTERGRFAAHAWVEQGGDVLDREHDRLERFHVLGWIENRRFVPKTT
jgi:hypothetical protein